MKSIEKVITFISENKRMKRKQKSTKKAQAIIFINNDQIIKIDLNKNELIQDKSDLNLLPVIRKTRKPPRRQSVKEISKEKTKELSDQDFKVLLESGSFYESIFDDDCFKLDETLCVDYNYDIKNQSL